MSPTPDTPASTATSFPRVSGDEPPGVDGYWGEQTFSPRERG